MDSSNKIKCSIGARVKEIRTKQRLTQEKLSETAGINPKYLSNIERGIENPTLNTLISLSESLDIQLPEMFDFDAHIDPEDNRKIINSLLEKAQPDQLRMIAKLISVILH